jgi:hypothetical protein
MVDHYSHVRRAAKRVAVDKMASGLMAPDPNAQMTVSKNVN